MSHSDELRILAEMKTFTQSDLAEAIGCTNQWASQVFSELVREKVIHRVRVGHAWLYALTYRGQARVAKMPVIDPEERCLPLDWEGVTPCECFHNQPCLIEKQIVGMINHGATQVIQEDVFCSTCGEWWSSARYTNTPF